MKQNKSMDFSQAFREILNCGVVARKAWFDSKMKVPYKFVLVPDVIEDVKRGTVTPVVRINRRDGRTGIIGANCSLDPASMFATDWVCLRKVTEKDLRK